MYVRYGSFGSWIVDIAERVKGILRFEMSLMPAAVVYLSRLDRRMYGDDYSKC